MLTESKDLVSHGSPDSVIRRQKDRILSLK